MGAASLFSSYHCSRYNTNTGVLTTEMFRNVFAKVRGLFGLVTHEFHQRAVGIPEVDGSARPFGAIALHWPALDDNTLRVEVRDGVLDRTDPFEAEVAIAGLYRQPRDFGGLYSRTMHVELLVAEAIGKATGGARHKFGAEYLRIEIDWSVPSPTRE